MKNLFLFQFSDGFALGQLILCVCAAVQASYLDCNVPTSYLLLPIFLLSIYPLALIPLILFILVRDIIVSIVV